MEGSLSYERNTSVPKAFTTTTRGSFKTQFLQDEVFSRRDRLRVGGLNGFSGRGAAGADDAEGTHTQSHSSPSILVYEDYTVECSSHLCNSNHWSHYTTFCVLGNIEKAGTEFHDNSEDSFQWS